MRLATRITIQVKNGFLPHLINEIYKKSCESRNLILLESRKENDLFLIEILYHSQDKFGGLLNKISKHEDNFQIISRETILENEIVGGLLNIAGKLQIENIIDYEMNVLGATELMVNMFYESENQEENIQKYSGLCGNVGLFCGVPENNISKVELSEIYARAERDSIIIKKFSGLNAFPLIVKINQIEDIIKNLKSIEDTFSAIRILLTDEIFDFHLYERIYSDLSKPVLTRAYDEIPLFLLISIFHLLKRNDFNLKEINVGFIGINISSLRLARILLRIGFPRVLGYDNNVKLMHCLEQEGGLATSQENIFNNTDLIILFKNQYEIDDFQKIGSGQIIISLLKEKVENNIIKKRGVRDFLQSGWMDFSAFYPGILKGLIKTGEKNLDDKKIIELSNRIFDIQNDNEVIPNVFSDINNRIPDLINELF